jgi:peptidoglycan/xylan/chitin deacetylase (PgdA/CDA1 family)
MIAGKRRLAAVALDRPTLRRASAWRGVLILNYHRVGDAHSSDVDRSLWSATAEQFDRQLAELARHTDVIGPADLEDVVRRGRGRYVMLTFDDGYRDNFEIAYPLLRAHNVRATFFLTTGFLDAPRAAWWDEIAWMVRHGDEPPAEPEPVIRSLTERYKRLPASETARFLDEIAERTGAGRCPPALGGREWMTWDMAREMRDAGMWFGGHTVDHPILASLPAAGQRRQITACARRFEAELGEPMRLFAYPVGSRDAFTPETARILRRNRVRQAFSFYGGYQRMHEWNSMDIPRAHVGPWCDQQTLRAMLSFPQLFARGV